MKKLSSVVAAALVSLGATQTFAQTPYVYDVLKYSDQKMLGTARMQGIGGASVAVGGDATNLAVNPAGLGYYNRSEISISPVFGSTSTNTSYINQSVGVNNSNLGVGQVGLVFSRNASGSRKMRSAFGIGYTRLGNFAREYGYSGISNTSSMSDAFAERASASGKNSSQLDDEFNTTTVRTFSPEGLYYQTFMIDPVNTGGYRAVEMSIPVNQTGKVQESGNSNQLNFSYGVNFDDKTYLGASIGYRTMNYFTLRQHGEVFPKAQKITSFDYFDELSVRGGGLNFTLGGIFRPVNAFQLGVSFTSPTTMALSETFRAGNSVRFVPNTIQTKYPSIETAPNDFEFRMVSPYRGNIGAAFFLPSKLGFISTELEYVGYKSMNVRDPQNTAWSARQQSDIQAIYKNALNLKVGGEIRVSNARLRAGVNYLGSPYQQASDKLSNSQLIYNAGLGYRTNRFFFDVAGSFNTFTDAYTPYTVANPADYASALITNRNTAVTISVGTFF